VGRLGRERCEHLVRLREPADLLLREDGAAVGDDVELALLARDDLGRVPASVELGRETRGPLVVAASDGAEEDAHVRHARDSSRPPG